jgi:hypothetical protein
VKLPKSFLAINLSETHTFHRRDSEDGTSNEQLGNAASAEKNNDSENTERLNDDLKLAVTEAESETLVLLPAQNNQTV